MSTLLITETFPPKTGGSGRWFWEIYRRQPIDQYSIAAGLDPQQPAFDATQELQTARMPLSFTDLGMLSFTGIKGYLAALRSLGDCNFCGEIHDVTTRCLCRQMRLVRPCPKCWLASDLLKQFVMVWWERLTSAMSMARKSSCRSARPKRCTFPIRAPSFPARNRTGLPSW